MESTRIELYPFSYFDLMRRKWVRARYRAQLQTIAERYPAFQITGAAEIRDGGDSFQMAAGHLARGPKERG